MGLPFRSRTQEKTMVGNKHLLNSSQVRKLVKTVSSSLLTLKQTHNLAPTCFQHHLRACYVSLVGALLNRSRKKGFHSISESSYERDMTTVSLSRQQEQEENRSGKFEMFTIVLCGDDWMWDDWKRYQFKDLKWQICEFQTCFIPDLLGVMVTDNTMKPFNLHWVKKKKSSTSEDWAHSICEKKRRRGMFSGYHSTSGLTHKQNGHARWPFSHSQSWRGPRDWWKSHIYNANNLSFSEHTVCSHSYCKPMSSAMANLMTSQVHSTHATALVAKKGKKQNKWGKTEVLIGTVTWLQQCRSCLFGENTPTDKQTHSLCQDKITSTTPTCDHPSLITLKL